LTKWTGGGLSVSQRDWAWGIDLTCSAISFVYEYVVEYVKTGDPRYLEKATEEILGDYLEHVLTCAVHASRVASSCRYAPPGGR